MYLTHGMSKQHRAQARRTDGQGRAPGHLRGISISDPNSATDPSYHTTAASVRSIGGDRTSTKPSLNAKCGCHAGPAIDAGAPCPSILVRARLPNVRRSRLAGLWALRLRNSTAPSPVPYPRDVVSMQHSILAPETSHVDCPGPRLICSGSIYRSPCSTRAGCGSDVRICAQGRAV